MLVESAQDVKRRVVLSEAPRSGWPGNVDVAVDFAAISKQLLRDSKGAILAKAIAELSGLNKATSDDGKIPAGARIAADELE